MGAANSKKRRKERKKRKSSATYPAGIPRSASADVIRSLHVMPMTPACVQCGGPRQRMLSTSLGDKWNHLDLPKSCGPTAITRTFSDSLAASRSYYSHGYHCSVHHCSTKHSNALHCSPRGCSPYCTGPQDDSGWDSDYGPQVASPYNTQPLHPSYPSWSHPRPTHPPTCGSHNILRSLTQPPTCMATSTMSLTRGVPQRQFHSCRSRSSDFRDSETSTYPPWMSDSEETPPIPGNDPLMSSSPPCPTSESSSTTYQQDVSPQSQFTVTSSAPTKLTAPRDKAVRKGGEGRMGYRQSFIEGDNTEQKDREERSNEGRERRVSERKEGRSGVHLTLVEDERARLARWEQSKLRAQQLRLLRRHIQALESGQVPPPPAPPPSLLKQTDAPLPKNNNPSPPSPQPPVQQNPTNTEMSSVAPASQPPKKPPRSKFSKRSNYRCLDNHPVLSKLQNEQNNRLERLEQRMCQIKASAMQEAQRRHFAEIFPAREDNSENERLMQEARVTLKLLQAEKEKRLASSCSNSSPSPPDSNELGSPKDGDIIPVHVLSGSETVCDRSHGDRNFSHSQSGSLIQTKKERGGHVRKSHWLNDMWPYINLGQTSTWLLLPFLLFPLVLRLLLSLVISLSSNNNSDNSNESSNSTSHSTSVTRPEIPGSQHCGLTSRGKTSRGESWRAKT